MSVPAKESVVITEILIVIEIFAFILGLKKLAVARPYRLGKQSQALSGMSLLDSDWSTALVTESGINRLKRS